MLTFAQRKFSVNLVLCKLRLSLRKEDKGISIGNLEIDFFLKKNSINIDQWKFRSLR